MDNVNIDQLNRYFDKQIDRWLKRGMDIDRETARQRLAEVASFHLEGYALQFMTEDGHAFRRGTSFDQIWAIYHADRLLKNFLFDYLAIIEVKLRNLLAGVISMNYGDFGHLHRENFNDPEYHAGFLASVEREFEIGNEPFIDTYSKRYNKDALPIWMAVEIITLGSLSKLYSNLKRKDMKQISRFYGVKSEEVLISYLKAMTELRNICAHHGRLYNRHFTSGCAILNEDRATLRALGSNFEIDPYSPFAGILGMSHVLNEADNLKLIAQLAELFEAPGYDKAYLGFPKQWQEVLRRAV